MNSIRKVPFKPGEILRSQMNELETTPDISAEMMGFTVEKIHEILNGKASLSCDEAYRLELFTDVFMMDWKPDRRN